MYKKYIILICLLLGCLTIFAQKEKDDKREQPQAKEAIREYSIIVFERDSLLSFDKEISKARSGGFFGQIYDVYRNTFVGKITSLPNNIIGTGVDLLVNSLNQKKHNHSNWHKVINKEMTFTKRMPMQTEIADFYRNTSQIGAMDPEGMMFNGFGCRQYLSYKDDYGNTKKILVFDIACSLDDSQRGKQRILHHGKFEVKVDSIRFNPYLCNLPNDSLTARQVDQALRIPFDFERRKNLTFRLNANITSSWMNEAIEIFKDQQLGEFQVEFTIPDSTVLDSDGEWKGYYTYNSNSMSDRNNPNKNIKVSGECFIVPRSYIGNYNDSDDANYSTALWGTGQYRIDMRITETCEINPQYYDSEDKWKEEWKKIKKRKHSPTFLNIITQETANVFDLNNHKWVYTILDPVQSAVIVEETKWVNNIFGIEGNHTTSTKPQGSNTQQRR